MCHYKTLHKNEHGYIVRCNHCRHIHVAFGNTVMVFTNDQFTDFVRCINDQYELHQYDCCLQHARTIQIPTAASAVVLIYNIRELGHFQNLLKKATDLLQREELFSFNYN